MILDDLKIELRTSKDNNNTFVTNRRLEKLIAHYEAVDAMEKSSGRLQWHIRESQVDARYHDGSDESATKIFEWVSSLGGDARVWLKGSLDYDLDNAYIAVGSPRLPETVAPHWWVVYSWDKQFYLYSNSEFRHLHELR